MDERERERPGRAAPQGLGRLFAEPDFLRLWLVGLVVFLVRWLETLAVALFVLDATGSAFLVAMMTMLRLLPMGLFGAFLGAQAERLESRSALLLLVGTNVLISVVVAALALGGVLAVWHLAVASFLGGIGWAADNPVRRLAIGQVVGPARLGQAMSLDVGTNNASRLVGPAVAGALFALAGIAGSFVLGAVLHLLALFAALAIRHRSGVAPAGGEGVLARVSAGLALARRDRRLRGILLVTIIFNIFGWPFTALIPVIAREVHGLTPVATGVLASMDGLGSLLGALVLGFAARPALYGRIYLAGVTGYLAALVLFALAPNATLAGMALLVNGFAQSGFSVMQATLVYLAAPPEMRSRLLGVLTLCIGLGPIGFVLIGLAAEWLGAPMACLLSGAAGLVTLALTARSWRPILQEETRPP